jgi:hypothetical protein
MLRAQMGQYGDV